MKQRRKSLQKFCFDDKNSEFYDKQTGEHSCGNTNTLRIMN